MVARRRFAPNQGRHDADDDRRPGQESVAPLQVGLLPWQVTCRKDFRWAA